MQEQKRECYLCKLFARVLLFCTGVFVGFILAFFVGVST